MIDIPERIKELYRKNNIFDETVKTARLRFYDGKINLLYPGESVWPSDDLYPVDDTPLLLIDKNQVSSESFVLEQALCDNSDLKFGHCSAAKVEIIVSNVTLDVTGKEFMLSLEVGGYEMMMGIYKVDSFVRQADGSKRKIIAYDRMREFDSDVSAWYQGLTFPLSLKQFRTSLCEYVGIMQQDVTLPLDDMQMTKTIDPSQISGRDVMKAICEINGCFGQIDITGKFKYVFLGASGLFPSEELHPADDLFPSQLEGENLSHYNPSGTTYEDFLVYGIDRVQIRQEEGDVGAIYGGGRNTYTIQGNFLVYGKSSQELLNIASRVHDQISGRVYRPCKIVTQALPWVEPGDGIICYTSDDVIETYCLKRTIKGIQAMMDTFEASGSRERKQNFGIGTQIIQLEGKTAVIKKSVEEVSVRVTDLKAETEAQFKVTAEQIIAEVTRAKQAEASLNIRADEIGLSVKNLKEYTEGQFRVTADQILAKVSKGDVSAQLSVESDKVTISGNRLIVNSNNFQLDGDGNATFSGRIIGGTINIGGGAFYVDSAGNAGINAGEINLGGVSINPNYSDFGAFRIAAARYGALFSTNQEVVLSTSAWVDGGPALELKRNGLTTRVGHGGVSTGDIYLKALDDEYGPTWSSVARNIIELWNRIASLGG